MGYWLKGGMMGLIVVLFLSMALTPAICITIQQRYPLVSCHLEDNLMTLSRIYLQSYFFLLLILGFIAGGLIARLLYLTRLKFSEKNQVLNEKLYGEPKFRWMWEQDKK